MRSFAFANPKSVDEVGALLARHAGEAALLAGGTDLLSLMKDNVESPGLVINLKSVPGLDAVRSRGDRLEIGALVTLEALRLNPDVRNRFPALAQAVEGVSSPQVRNRGTVAGDLCQRPRCWYYRKGYGLLALNDGRSMVRDGDNRYHAILGNQGNALYVNPSSLAPALIALGAKLKIRGPKGERTTALADFYRVPTSNQEKEHTLGPQEWIVSLEVEIREGLANAVYEVRQREALDWPLAAAAAAVAMDGSKVREARIVLGHVAPVPWVASAASNALQGKVLDQSSAEEAATAAVEGAQALSRNAYKIRLARTAVKRALMRAAGMEV